MEEILKKEISNSLGICSPKVFSFYRKVASWLLDLAQETTLQKPLLIGLNAPQGAGKTTLTQVLSQTLTQIGHPTIAISIDDFYLTREKQIRLASENPQNPYLQQRGYPGTHDLELGQRTLQALKKMNGTNTFVKIPIYDKSLHQGLGDRLDEGLWKTVSPPQSLVILEGWMLGFSPCAPLNDPHLQKINELLSGYFAWSELLDGFLLLSPTDTHFVVDWRIEAEAKMREKKGAGMSPEAVAAYVRLFLPAYEEYLPLLGEKVPCPGRNLSFLIGKDRLPV